MPPVLSLAVLTSAFLAVAVLERSRLHFAPSPFLRPYLFTDAAWYLVATGSATVFAVVLQPQLSRLALPVVADGMARLPTLLVLPIAVAVYDGVAFTVHVAIHRSDSLWTIHKVHHSSRQLDWLASTRTHVFEHLVRNLPAQAALFAAGVPVRVIVAALTVYGLCALLGHSNLRLPLAWAEPVFITPRLHRVHHIPATSQKNFGTVLSLWDRLAGTLVTHDVDADATLGVPGEITTYPQRFPAALRQPARELHVRRSRSDRPSMNPATDRRGERETNAV